MNILSLILVFDAAILASMSGPDLPDDFKKPEANAGAVVVADADQKTPASVLFSTAPAQSQLQTTTKTVTERWLVSESWCPNCPAAKRKFLDSGGSPSNVITIAEALSLHGKTIPAVPAEFTTEREVTYIQPPTYRLAPAMSMMLDNSPTPSKEAILNHLRRGKPHQGKHWQAWHLESWSKEQLYALHDDDHDDVVPTFNESPAVTATITTTTGTLSADLIAETLAEHLHRTTSKAPQSGLFQIEIDTPESARVWIADLLLKQSVDFPSAGVSVSWKGSDRTISVAPGKLSIKPGAAVSAKKFLVTINASLDGVAYAEDLSWVTLELGGAPDLTIRLN